MYCIMRVVLERIRTVHYMSIWLVSTCNGMYAFIKRGEFVQKCFAIVLQKIACGNLRICEL